MKIQQLWEEHIQKCQKSVRALVLLPLFSSPAGTGKAEGTHHSVNSRWLATYMVLMPLCVLLFSWQVSFRGRDYCNSWEEETETKDKNILLTDLLLVDQFI